MKTLMRTTLFCTLATMLFACKKSTDTSPVAAGVLNVTNAVVGGATITLTNNAIISSNNTVSINGYAWLPLASGNISVNLGVPAVAATPTTPAIPAVPYYSTTLAVDNSSNYSLFLSGNSPSTVESVLIKESYPYAYQDSTCGVRYINLAPGSNPVSVNVKGSANGSEVSSLVYKAYSDFIKHPSKRINSSYIFEFRDATSGTLITSYTLTTPYFHNVTLILRGKVGGSPAAGVTIDYDYQ
jgi:hypothetical protein